MTLRLIKAGTTLLVTDQDAAATKFVAAAHAKGESATERGVTSWVSEAPVFDATAEGAARYVWHKDGNRVKVTRTLVTKHADGTVTRRVIGSVWRHF